MKNTLDIQMSFNLLHYCVLRQKEKGPHQDAGLKA